MRICLQYTVFLNNYNQKIMERNTQTTKHGLITSGRWKLLIYSLYFSVFSEFPTVSNV